MAYDLGIEMQTDGSYKLVGPVEGVLERMRNRWTVQFLSHEKGFRGSLFVSQMKRGRVKTNADIVNLFALSAAQIISNMKQYADGVYPNRAELSSFEFINPYHIVLYIELVSRLGTVNSVLDVEVTEP